MRITMLGVLGFIAMVTFLVYVGYELGKAQEKQPSPSMPPLPSNS